MGSKDLLKYAGLAFQLFATLSVAFFIGFKIDQYLAWSFPLFLIVLPLLVMVALFYKIFKDTQSKSK